MAADFLAIVVVTGMVTAGSLGRSVSGVWIYRIVVDDYNSQPGPDSEPPSGG